MESRGRWRPECRGMLQRRGVCIAECLVLAQVLGSDEDMAALYLSHRIVEGSNRAVDQHREVRGSAHHT